MGKQKSLEHRREMYIGQLRRAAERLAKVEGCDAAAQDIAQIAMDLGADARCAPEAAIPPCPYALELKPK